MKPTEQYQDQLNMDNNLRDIFIQRHTLAEGIRNFFSRRGYVEVDTPIFSEKVIPESSIHLFSTTEENPFSSPIKQFLLPSPEYWMKKLISRGIGNCFQMGKCFRNGESRGKHHNPEFTMLEWYTNNADYIASMETTKALLENLADYFPNRFPLPVEILSVKEIFLHYTGINLEQINTIQQFKEISLSIGIDSNNAETWEEIFNLIFLTRVEPSLSRKGAIFLKDYPRFIRCLAKEIPNSIWVERWELYINGMEIANCYSEEVDSIKIRSLFKEEDKILKKSPDKPEIDWDFPELFKENFPPCSGTALGFDRLLMYCTEVDSIDRVIPFLEPGK